MTTYKEVNASWPSPVPVPTPREAIYGTKRLIKRAFALAKEDGAGHTLLGCGPYMKRMKFKITSGRRRTSPYYHGTWYINPNESGNVGGWAEIVHSVSHWAGHRFWPNESAHSPRHVWIEQQLTAYAIEHRPQWIAATAEGRLKPKPDVKTVRAARVASAIRRWQTKRKRADTALRKLRRQARYYGLESGTNP